MKAPISSDERKSAGFLPANSSGHTKPIRVAHVVGKMVGGGVESFLMNYFRHIDRTKIQFDLIVDADSKLVPFDEIEGLGGRVFIVPPYQDLMRYQKRLFALLSKEKWTIVHSHLNALSVFPLRIAKSAGVPIRIAHSHSTSGRGELLKNTMKSLLKTQSRRYATEYLACTEDAGKWLFGKNSDFVVVKNAIDLPRFAFCRELRVSMRRQLGILPGQKVIGHIGRFTTQKNHAFLLDVFAEVAKEDHNALLLLVGEGELKESAAEKVRALGLEHKVRFLGQRDDIERIYQAFDVFLLPSLYEGLGMVGIEAQRSGLPCIFSDCVPAEARISHNVVSLPISPGDVGAWADAVLSLGQDNRSLSEQESARFDSYDIEKAAEKLMFFYIDKYTRACEDSGCMA